MSLEKLDHFWSYSFNPRGPDFSKLASYREHFEGGLGVCRTYWGWLHCVPCKMNWVWVYLKRRFVVLIHKKHSNVSLNTFTLVDNDAASSLRE